MKLALSFCPEEYFKLWLEDDAKLIKPLHTFNSDKPSMWSLHHPAGFTYMGLGAIGLMFNAKGYEKYSACADSKIPERPVPGTLNGPDSVAAKCCRTAVGPARCLGAGYFVKHTGNIFSDSTNIRDVQR